MVGLRFGCLRNGIGRGAGRGVVEVLCSAGTRWDLPATERVQRGSGGEVGGVAGRGKNKRKVVCRPRGCGLN